MDNDKKKNLRRCMLCGAATESTYCKKCNKLLKNKTVKEVLSNDKQLAKLLSKHGCLYCPLYESSFCNMLFEHITCHNAEDEIKLCTKYLVEWMNHKGN